MPAHLMALALIVLPTIAQADSRLPWFGSVATSGFELSSEATSNVQAAPQLRMSAEYRCSDKTCGNSANVKKASPDKTGSPQ